MPAAVRRLLPSDNALLPLYPTTPLILPAGIRFQCKLGDSNGNITSAAHSDWQNCTSPATYDSLPDGAYQFAVRAEVGWG